MRLKTVAVGGAAVPRPVIMPETNVKVKTTSERDISAHRPLRDMLFAPAYSLGFGL